MSKKSKPIRALLIANPGSGKVEGKSALFEQVVLDLKAKGIKLDVALAKPNAKATPIARAAVKAGYKLIIAMGGDDTIESVIRGMAKSKTVLGIIPAGTANNLARSLGISEDPKEACTLIAGGQIRKLDLAQVKVGKGKKFIFIDVLTVGIAAAVYTSAIHSVKGKGRLASIKEELYEFLTQPATPQITVEMDGQTNISVETMLVLVANFPLTGMNMLIDPTASTDDGLLDISMFPNIGKAELLAYGVGTLNEGKTDNGKITRYRARKLKIKSAPSLEVMADGVMLGKGTVKIKVLPGVLRVIAPPVGTGLEKPQPASAASLPTPIAPAAASAEAAAAAPAPVAVAEKVLPVDGKPAA